jgi:hypothetical protein
VPFASLPRFCPFLKGRNINVSRGFENVWKTNSATETDLFSPEWVLKLYRRPTLPPKLTSFCQDVSLFLSLSLHSFYPTPFKVITKHSISRYQSHSKQGCEAISPGGCFLFLDLFFLFAVQAAFLPAALNKYANYCFFVRPVLAA